MPVPLIIPAVASLIARAAVSTAVKRAITAEAAKGLTKRQVAELIVRNEATAAKTLASKGIKTGPKRYEYRGTKYSDPKLDAAYRASPEEGSVAAMAKRMAVPNPEKVAKAAAERAKIVRAKNRAQTVAREAKKKALTRTPVRLSERKPAAGPLTKKAALRAERNRRAILAISKSPAAKKRIAELAEQRGLNPVDAAKVAARVRPPKGYNPVKVSKPTKRATREVDTSVKVKKPATKRTPQEIKDAKEAARKRRITANARGRITGKDSVTKRPARPSRQSGPEEAARSARTRRAINKNKNRADEIEADDVPQGYWVSGKKKGDPREWISTEKDAGLMPGGGRAGKSLNKREPDRRNRDTEDDRGPKEEFSAIKKAFAELHKEEKALMREADARGIQGILREKVVSGANRKPAGPKDAPIRKYVPPSRKIETAKARIRLQRKKEIENLRKEKAELNKRLVKARRRLTPEQRKNIDEYIARIRRNAK